MPRTFRFLVSGGSAHDRTALVHLARRAEALGYSGLFLSDHLIDQLAPLPALALAAGATERLRLGTFVLNNDLRHPAVLAQELATLDVLSGGRLEVGMGAGWNVEEYDRAGIPFERAGVRISRLQEAITVLKGLFADEPLSFEGRHYRIDGMDGRPKPVQRPHPPVLVGGGSRRVLTLAAQEAQIVGLAPRVVDGKPDVAGCLPAGTDEKVAWVRAAAGSDFDGLEVNTYSVLAPVQVTDQPLAVAGELAGRIASRFGLELESRDLLDSPHVFLGTIQQLTEKCQAMRERWGINSVLVRGDAVDTFAPVVERLAGR